MISYSHPGNHYVKFSLYMNLIVDFLTCCFFYMWVQDILPSKVCIVSYYFIGFKRKPLKTY